MKSSPGSLTIAYQSTIRLIVSVEDNRVLVLRLDVPIKRFIMILHQEHSASIVKMQIDASEILA